MTTKKLKRFGKCATLLGTGYEPQKVDAQMDMKVTCDNCDKFRYWITYQIGKLKSWSRTTMRYKFADRLVTWAIYALLAAILAAELGMAYTIGRIDAEIEYTEHLIEKTGEYIELRYASQPAVTSSAQITVPDYPHEITVTEQPQETTVPEESAATVSGSYRGDVPLSRELQAVLRESCEETNVDVNLALGLIEAESDFNPEAVSNCGCYGYMQLHPAWFPPDLCPEDNIRIGISYLAECVARYGDL